MTVVVAFDNSGTLSEVTVAHESVAPGYEWLESVPEASDDRGEFVLLNVDCDLSAFRSDDPLGAVLADSEVVLRQALANCELSGETVQASVLRDEGLPARTLVETADRAVERARDAGRLAGEDPPRGVQLVVDLDNGTLVRVVGYTATPIPEAPEVVDWVRERGYEPHLVSGDAPGILQQVAGRVGIPAGHVHAFQSSVDKRGTVERLGGVGPVVMVGDHVNDRYAFDVADFGVFLDNGRDEIRSRLLPRADATIDHLSELPATLQDRAPDLLDDHVRDSTPE